MKIGELEDLISEGESSTLEFKRSTNTRSLNEAGQTLCGYLNRDGGTVLFGVTNDHKIIGQEVADKTKKDIDSILREIDPRPNISLDFVVLKDKKKVIVLSVNTTALNPPYYFRKSPYYRGESGTEIMPPAVLEEILEAKKWINKSWERLPAVGAKLEDLNIQEIQLSIEDGIKSYAIPESIDRDDILGFLDSLELLENGQITNACMVLFGKSLARKFPQCELKLARFRGVNKGEFIDSETFHGNAFEILRKVELFCKKHFPVASKIVEHKMQRETTPFLPMKAIREAIINAICHRDYTIYTGAIYFAMYDDRIEIENEGRLPKQLTVDDLKKRHRSYPRNRRIINAFARRGLVESWGRGTLEIIELCRRDGHPEPNFLEDRGGFIVQMNSKYPLNTVIAADYDSVEEDVTAREKTIMVALKSALHGLSSSLISKKVDIPERTIRRDLSKLEERGLVKSEGKGRARKWLAYKDNPAKSGQIRPNPAKPK